LENLKTLDGIFPDEVCDKHGAELSNPSDLVAVTQKLRQEYGISVCGYKNYIYLWDAKNKCMIEDGFESEEGAVSYALSNAV